MVPSAGKLYSDQNAISDPYRKIKLLLMELGTSNKCTNGSSLIGLGILTKCDRINICLLFIYFSLQIHCFNNLICIIILPTKTY